MINDLSLREIQKEWHGTLKSYVVGFLVSLLLTGISFGLVFTKFLSGQNLIYALIGLAIVQAIVQLIFFLHVGQEAKPRWETITFLFAVLFIIIVVIGSLWIMYDLDERVMSGMSMSKEMFHD